MEKISYSVVEVAQQLGISKTTAYNLCNDGTIPSIRLGKRIIVPVNQFHKWFEKGAAI